MRIRSRCCVLALAITVAAVVRLAPAAQARTVVVPNALASVEGTVQTLFPFSCSPSFTSQRHQQIYPGAEVGSGVITGIALRQDGPGGSAFGRITIPNVTITLSTTIAAVDALSMTFADNVGADVTTVFSGNLTLSSAACSSTPCPFDIVIPLMIPFSFDSSAGNLLLDVTIPTCAQTTEFDASSTPWVVARAFTTISGSASPTANVTSSRGLVTQFMFRTERAPTLSTWGIAALVVALFGSGALAVRRRLRI